MPFIRTDQSDRNLFLRADLLQPADVILTSGAGWSSKIVRLTTGGRFSHAILVIDELHRLDKVGSGMKSVLADIQKFEFHDQGIRWFDDISKYDQIAVYRHPEFQSLSVSDRVELAERLARFVERWEGLEYLPERLATARTLSWCRIPINLLASTVSRCRRTRPQVESPFCSELVAMFYEDVGIKLFPQPVNPRTVNPTMLSDAESSLQECHDVFDELNLELPNADELYDQLTATDAELPLLERMRIVKQRIADAYAEFEAASVQTGESIRRAA